MLGLVLGLANLLGSIEAVPTSLSCGKSSILEYGQSVRLLSHAKFNRKSFYPSKIDCTRTITVSVINNFVSYPQLGDSCKQLKVWCTYLQTISDKRCRKGDFIR